MHFSVLTWNIHGKRHITKTNFAKVAPALEKISTDIICLQEAGEAKKQLDAIRGLNEYHRILPSGGYNLNLILSKLPVLNKGDIVFPKFIKTPIQNALWADILVGRKKLRVYNCHFSIVGAGPSSREKQLQHILDHAESHDGPVIVCGDFNTTIPNNGLGRKLVQLFHLEPETSMYVGGEYVISDERYALIKVAEKRGFKEATDITKPTWRLYPFHWELFNLKLDWVLVRGVNTKDVVLHPYISDHRAIHAQCILEK